MPDGTENVAWHSTVPGITAEDIGHITTKGWDKLPPGEAALNAVRAHREAEKFVGAPTTELLRLPKDPNAPEWAGVWERLGAPKDKTGYDFSAVEKKGADGTTVENAKFVDTMREIAGTLHLPKDAAARVAQEFAKYQDGITMAETTEKAAKLTEEKAALTKNWGSNAEPNLFIAKQAAAKLGVSVEAVNALESVIGYKATMEMFHTIGTKIGEDKFLANPQDKTGGVMSRDQAVARLKELKRDEAWGKRLLAGDNVALREMRDLSVMITGDDGSRGA